MMALTFAGLSRRAAQYRERREFPALARRYEKAREAAGDFIADHCQYLARNITPGTANATRI